MMPDFVKRQLKDLLIVKLRGGLKSVTTIQSEKSLDWLISFIVYVIVFVTGSSLLGEIPGVVHAFIIYPLATYGILSLLEKLNEEEDDEISPQ
jgi:hypothetical protein